MFFDLAKSTISRALGPQGPSLPFHIGPKVLEQDQNSLWTLHEGTRKDDGQPVSVFIFDIKTNSKYVQLARNAFKRVKTIRFPDCLKYIDGAETETQIIIGTEQVSFLSTALDRGEVEDSLIKLGLFKVASTLKFLAHDCSMVHGNVNISSIFVTKSGEWKLGGFELVSHANDDVCMVNTQGHMLHHRHLSPEQEKTPSFPNPIHSLDIWAFACLIYQLFNKTTAPTTFSIKGSIPDRLFPLLKNCVHNNPRMRTDFVNFLSQATQMGGYFDDPLITTSIFLENFTIKEKTEKEQFLSDIQNTVENFPVAFSKFKILPELLLTLEFGGAGSKALKPILTIGGRLTSQDFNELVIPSIIKLFSSTDRAIRLALCEKIDSYVDHLSEKICTDTIYPNLVSGFQDSTAIIREQTLKAVAILSSKLSKKIINDSLIRYLTKLQVDPEPGIRTNTIICIVKLAKYFDDSIKNTALVQAFIRSLHDPFPPARKTSLIGISASTTLFSPEDLAKKMMPSICPLLVDPEGSIREQARLTTEAILKTLKNAPIPEIPTEGKTGTSKQEEGWTSWAFSAVKSGITKTAESTEPKGNNSSSSLNLKKEPEKNVPKPTQANTKPPVVPKPQSSTARKPMTLPKSTPSTTEWVNPVSDPKPVSKPANEGWSSWGDGWEEPTPPSQKKKAETKPIADGWGSNDQANSWDDDGWNDDGWGTNS